MDDDIEKTSLTTWEHLWCFISTTAIQVDQLLLSGAWPAIRSVVPLWTCITMTTVSTKLILWDFNNAIFQMTKSWLILASCSVKVRCNIHTFPQLKSIVFPCFFTSFSNYPVTGLSFSSTSDLLHHHLEVKPEREREKGVLFLLLVCCKTFLIVFFKQSRVPWYIIWNLHL